MSNLDEIAAKEIFGISDEEEYSYPNFMQLFPEQEFTDDDDEDDDDDDLEDDELDDVTVQDDDEEIIREDDEDEDEAGLSKEYF
jgi:hypothetical protein